MSTLSARLAARRAAAATPASQPTSRPTTSSRCASWCASSAASISRQYKRAQMERRVRTWTERRGTPDLAAYRPPAQGAGGARRVPGPRDDQRLAPVAPRGAVEALRKTCCPSSAARGRIRDLERRLVLRGRGLHDRRRSPAKRSRPCAVEIPAPTWTSAWSPAPATGVFTAEDARTSPQAMMQASLRAQPRRRLAGQAGAQAHGALRHRRPAAHAGPHRPLRRGLLPQHRHLLHRGGRDALHARLADALAPGGYLVVGTSERVADPRGAGPDVPVPLHLPEG